MQGPDDVGSVSLCGDRALVGHARLAIMGDFDMAAQPLNRCGVALTANGEVYRVLGSFEEGVDAASGESDCMVRASLCLFALCVRLTRCPETVRLLAYFMGTLDTAWISCICLGHLFVS